MHHKAQTLETPWGETVEIDCGIVPLIRLLWRHDIATAMSCQDSGGHVAIAVAGIRDAARYWVAAQGLALP